MGIIDQYHYELAWFKNNGYIGPFNNSEDLKRHAAKMIGYWRWYNGLDRGWHSYYGEGFGIPYSARLDYEAIHHHDPDLGFSILEFSKYYIFTCYSLVGICRTYFIICNWHKKTKLSYGTNI